MLLVLNRQILDVVISRNDQVRDINNLYLELFCYSKENLGLTFIDMGFLTA